MERISSVCLEMPFHGRGYPLITEAELVIATRKTAFNKALREYKRDQGLIPGYKKSSRLSASKPSKHVATNATQDEN